MTEDTRQAEDREEGKHTIDLSGHTLCPEDTLHIVHTQGRDAEVFVEQAPAQPTWTPAEYEAGLQEILGLIDGTRFPHSQGLRSCKTLEDPEAVPLHQACLELERRGLIHRVFEDEHIVGWMPVEESS